jgi:hypothetical protein
MGWARMFGAGSVAFIAAVVGIVWGLDGFAGLSGHGIAALIIGTVLSAGLGVALMGLVFFSARSGVDDAGRPTT